MTTRRESGVGDIISRSSSAELSSPPGTSPDPGSPSAQFGNEASAHQHSSIVVNPTAVAAPVRKKPGRKPKVSLDPNGSSATNTDAPKKRTRKPRDPNAPPPVPRKRKTPAASESSIAAQLKAAAGPERLPTPKIPETKPSIRDASFEVRPDTLGQPPSQNGKHEDIPTQRPIHSFFNAPPAPQPQQQPPPAQPPPPPQPLQYVLSHS